jgi:hypothetical protein
MAKRQGWEKGEGRYAKNNDLPVRRDTSIDNSGNPRARPSQANWDKLESNRGASGTRGSHPNPKTSK